MIFDFDIKLRLVLGEFKWVEIHYISLPYDNCLIGDLTRIMHNFKDFDLYHNIDLTNKVSILYSINKIELNRNIFKLL